MYLVVIYECIESNIVIHGWMPACLTRWSYGCTARSVVWTVRYRGSDWDLPVSLVPEKFQADFNGGGGDGLRSRGAAWPEPDGFVNDDRVLIRVRLLAGTYSIRGWHPVGTSSKVTPRWSKSPVGCSSSSSLGKKRPMTHTHTATGSGSDQSGMQNPV